MKCQLSSHTTLLIATLEYIFGVGVTLDQQKGADIGAIAKLELKIGDGPGQCRSVVPTARGHDDSPVMFKERESTAE